MEKITSLTQEQTAALKPFADKWIADKLSTATVRDNPDKARLCEEGYRECYRIAKLDADVPMVWVYSPLVGALVAPLADNIIRARKLSGAAVVAILEDLIPRVEAVIGRGGSSAEAVKAVTAAHTDAGKVWWHGWRCGGYWSSWTAYVVAMRDIVGVQGIDPRFDQTHLKEAEGAQWWPNRNFILACDRPSRSLLDTAGRLHSLTSPALEWRDGAALYYVNGVAVPKFVVMAPETITTEMIDRESNAEVRRVMMERFGIARYVTESGGKVIHTDVDSMGHPRRLLRRDVPGDDPVVIVEVKNSSLEPDGSRRTYHLGVHHELRPLLEGDGQYGEPQEMTCHNAVASTFGLRGEEYSPQVES